MPDGRAERREVVRRALRNRMLTRALLAFFEFNLAELGVWVAFLVWAYAEGGIRAASVLAVVQLAPAAVLAPVAAGWLTTMGRATALALGYLVQGVTFAACGLLLAFDAPYLVVVAVSATAGFAVTLTRPVHYALLPLVSESTEDLTAGNGLSTATEGAAAVGGPLLSGLLTGWLGPEAVLLCFAATSLLAAAGTRNLPVHGPAGTPSDVPPTPTPTPAPAPERVADVLRATVREPGATLLSVLIGAGYVVVGTLDLLLVALALGELGTDESGPGVLNAALGVGTLVAGFATVVLVGRRHLAPAALVGVAVLGSALAAMGMVGTLAAALVLAAVAETGKSFYDLTVRIMTQRALPDRLLNAVFGLQESMLMAGLCVGALLAPLVVAALGTQGAFVAIGLLLPAVVAVTYPWLRRIDARAEVPMPVFELFASVPMLSLLGQGVLERLAREAGTETVSPGRAVVTEGDPGDLFYVLADGRAEVTIEGRHVRELGPGDCFGEIALLRSVPRTATVSAITDLTLSTIARDPFLAALTRTPQAMTAGEDHVRGYEGLS